MDIGIYLTVRSVCFNLGAYKMYDMFWKDAVDEDDDDWFYDSIKRYKQLQMFDFENVIYHIELTDPKSICVASKHKSGRHELLELFLPQKLTVAPSQEGLVKNSDLKMRNGGFMTAPIAQIKSLWCRRQILVSEEGQVGASIYNLGSVDSDLITKVGTLTCELTTPCIAFNNQDLVIFSTSTKNDFVLMDLNKCSIINKNKIDPKSESNDELKSSFVSENLAVFCEGNTGNMYLHDVRAATTVEKFSCAKSCNRGKELWTLTTNYNNNRSSCSNYTSKFGLISTLGKLAVFDIRNIGEAICSADIGKLIDLNPLSEEYGNRHIIMNFAPDDDSKISVSGFNGHVYVYDVSSSDNFKTVFTHDGHMKQSNNGVNSSITSHTWYRENILISASQNCDLHCWQFISDSSS